MGIFSQIHVSRFLSYLAAHLCCGWRLGGVRPSSLSTPRATIMSASSRTRQRHHDMDRAGNLLPCADRCCGVLGLTMAMCSPDVGLKWSCANVEARSERQTTRPAEIIQRAGAVGQLP